jgi:hypothetical protein
MCQGESDPITAVLPVGPFAKADAKVARVDYESCRLPVVRILLSMV